ncbi:MAG: N-acetyl-alpha-D-glucosaminyl L-malate synthase BshA [Firmicutes bacterium]|nr:N-acetyl-alpha-D-glucosaminyl L-malate synthase BshA [Bacillota bacterium]
MKIGILCYPTYGGSGVVATELGKELARRGHIVHFINSQLPVRLDGDGFSDKIFFHEVSVPNYPLFSHPPYTLALAGRVVQVIKEQGLDLIHAHYAVPHSLVAVLAREISGQARVVTTLHGTDITLVGTEPSFLDVTRYAIEASDCVTAVSASLARDTRELLAVNKEVHTVYNFVNPDIYRPVPPAIREVYVGEGEHLLIHISNFRPVKRVPDVIEVFARVRESVPAVLLLVGDGPQHCHALAKARELGVSEHVCFLGQQREVVPLLSASDVMLLPSEQESFGLAALEAMACGVPVVASTAGGLPEVVADGIGGRLLPVGDTRGMAAATLEILGNPRRWREGALERAQNFSSTRWVAEYEALYRQVLA